MTNGPIVEKCLEKTHKTIQISLANGTDPDQTASLVQCNSGALDSMPINHHQDNMSACFIPLAPHFYKVKLGFTGVYIHYFLIFALKHILWVLVRTASLRRF